EGVAQGGLRVFTGVGAVLAGRVLAAAGLGSGADGGEQVVQHGLADRAGQGDLVGWSDPGGGDDLVAGGLDRDGEADPVRWCIRLAGQRVGGDSHDGLVDGQQGVHFLVDVVGSV